MSPRRPVRRRCRCWPGPDRSRAPRRTHAVPDSGPRSRGRCRACGSTCAPRRETPSQPAAAGLRRVRTCRASVRRHSRQARTARRHGTGSPRRRGSAGRAHGRTRHSRRRAWPRSDRTAPAIRRQDGLHRDLEAGALVQRGLLDLGRSGPVSRRAVRGENPVARLTDGVDARPQVAQEDRLGDD